MYTYMYSRDSPENQRAEGFIDYSALARAKVPIAAV